MSYDETLPRLYDGHRPYRLAEISSEQGFRSRPIANDRVGVQIGKYEAGDITLDQFLQNLKYMKGITFQYYFGTERAISKLSKL